MEDFTEGIEAMTSDKGLSIFLAVLFGLSGIAILALTWLRPMGGVERVLSTGIGAGGTFISLSRMRHVRSNAEAPKAKSEESPIEVAVEAKD